MSTPVQTLQEQITILSPDDVLSRARHFFARRNGIYSTFLELEGPAFVTFRGQGGEEVVIATAKHEAGTRVTGSSYLFDMQVARFLSTLPPSPTGPVVPIIEGATAAPGASKP
jgi:hypothetical protein